MGRKAIRRSLLQLGAGAVLMLSVPPLAQARIQMWPVAVLPSGDGWLARFPCGDADHDGFEETYCMNSEELRLFEHCGNNQYQELTFTRRGVPYAFGDPDGDGLSDILVRQSLLESIRPDTFPSESVWSYDDMYLGGGTSAFADLDKDGRCDIIVTSRSGLSVTVFENRGDNDYERVPVPRTSAYEGLAIADFDRDSLIEFVAGDNEHFLYVFECAGQDSYVVACSMDLSPEAESYDITQARDMDRDGRPEFVVVSELRGEVDSCVVSVFEAVADNQYVPVWHHRYRGGAPQWRGVAAGDIDGDDIDEFAVATGQNIRLFRCATADSFEEVWSCPGGGNLRLYDLNRNGRCELIFSTDSTRIYEDTAGLGMAEFERLPKPSQVRAQPAIARAGQAVRLSGLAAGSVVQVHDACGRLVRETALLKPVSWDWDLRDTAGRPVPAGTYIAVIRSPQQSASLKLCVIR